MAMLAVSLSLGIGRVGRSRPRTSTRASNALMRELRRSRHGDRHRRGRQDRARQGLRRAPARFARSGRRRHDLPDRLDGQGDHRRGAGGTGRRRQDRLGRQGHRPPAGLPDVRPVGHARDDRCATCSCIAAAWASARATCCSCRAPRAAAPRPCSALRYIKPATSFRSGYAYDNILYIGRRPAHRRGQRPDLGSLRARSRVQAGWHERSTTDRRRPLGHRQPRTTACAR